MAIVIKGRYKPTSGEEKLISVRVNSIGQIETTPYASISDKEVLVTDEELTSSYADLGGEIDMRGYNRLGVYIITDVNDSENVSLKVLGKHTSAGTDEYEIDGISVKTLWTTSASDGKIYYTFDTDGAIPFIQLQAVAGTVGATAGDLSIVITKSYV